jgi:hypothetical protein
MSTQEKVKRRTPVDEEDGGGFISRNLDKGPLHNLLLRACPPDPETGEKSIYRLAALLGVSKTAPFNWIDKNSVPSRRAGMIVDISEGRVTLSDLAPYVFY